jgi:multidrug efflux system membrane fusion protein
MRKAVQFLIFCALVVVPIWVWRDPDLRALLLGRASAGDATVTVGSKAAEVSLHETKRKKVGGEMPPVPVQIGVAESRDFSVYLNGLGNVQGLNTVSVRSRVEGQIVAVRFKEGQDVKAGDVLVEIDPKPFQAALNQALARRAQNVAQLDNARADLVRIEELIRTEVETPQKRDTQKALVDQLAATVQADEAAIEAAQVQLDYATVRSPIAGRTGLRQVDEGNVVRAGDQDPIVVVTQVTPVSVVFTLPEQHTQVVRRALEKGGVQVLSMGRDNRTQLAEGKLMVVDNQIDSTTGTIRMKADFPNEDRRLWPGQFVNVRVRAEVREKAVTVPATAVQRGPMGTYVFRIAEGETCEIAKVVTGPSEQGFTVIESGLVAGDRVVVDGHFRLQPGAKVRALGGEGGPKKGESPKTAAAPVPKAS